MNIYGKKINWNVLVEKFFRAFTKKTIIDAKKSAEVINSLSFDSKKEVDVIASKAIKAGAKMTKSNDHGWMYQKGFEDLDGHLWEIFWMDPKGMPKN